jgi:hypothetical protein
MEDLHLLRVADGTPDDVLERHVRLGLACDELVQLVHVGLVVLAVMVARLPGIDLGDVERPAQWTLVY